MAIGASFMGLAIFIGLSAAALASPPAVTDQPPEITSYIHSGRYTPGEFVWVRGAFGNASPEERATYLRIAKWATECLEKATAKVKADLAARGYPNPALDNVPVGPLLCRQLAIQPLVGERKDVLQFEKASARGALISDAFLSAVSLAESTARSGSATPADALRAQTLGEQMLRQALSWRSGPMKDAPELTEDERQVVLARISIALTDADHENTELLKAIVGRYGWPKISEFGAGGARAAWLLAQHADADPIFQLDILKQMEPMVPTGEVSKQDYAYLYDRVFLKVNGRQRYGTQTSCFRGVRAPEHLEDAAKVDEFRKTVGLAPESTYLAQLDSTLGRCPSS